MPTTVFEDDRTDVLGAHLRLNHAKLEAMRTAAEVPQDVSLKIILRDNTTEDIAQAICAPLAPGEPWILIIPTSDRLEFSDSALSRLNTVLAEGLRVIADVTNLASVLTYIQRDPHSPPLHGALEKICGTQLDVVIRVDAYRFSRRNVKNRPERFALLSIPIELAEDPQTTLTDGGE